MSKILSTDIKVFPSSMRLDSIDRNARLMSEQNITALVNRLTSKDSFVINGLSFSSISNNDITISAGTCNIAGYWFNISSDQVYTISGTSNAYICLKIQTKATTIDGVTFTELYSASDLDSSSKFNGLEIVQISLISNWKQVDGSGTTTYYLPIIYYNGTNWVNYEHTFTRNDGTTTSASPFNSCRLKAKDIEWSTSEADRQTLDTYLTDNLIIDDGQIS